MNSWTLKWRVYQSHQAAPPSHQFRRDVYSILQWAVAVDVAIEHVQPKKKDLQVAGWDDVWNCGWDAWL